MLTGCSKHGAAGRRALYLACLGVLAFLGGSAHAADAPKGDARATAQTEWSDPVFNQPYIDIDEWRDAPVRHRYVHGGFKGTGARFSFYFPPKEQYTGRFFETASPVPQSENTAQNVRGENNNIAFSAASGAYFVETNQGGDTAASNCTTADPSPAGYRVNAAAAQYSRVLAKEMYGPKRPYGYLYGGSGGAFRTVAGVENTTGVWDGSVPYVLGTTLTLPSMLTVRLNAVHMLEGKFPAIVDAIDVGGSGDMYAGLDPDQRQALLEATRMGFNPKGWAAYKGMTLGVYPVLIGPILKCDPTYLHDFWTAPGYGGASPSEFIKHAHFDMQTTITKLITPAEAEAMKLNTARAPGELPAVDAWKGLLTEGGQPVVAIQTETMPAGDPEGAVMTIKSGGAAGETIRIDNTVGNVVPLRFGLGGVDPHILAKLKVGDKVEIDNSTFLAVLLYHRYQVPQPSRYPDYHAWDQYLGPDGRPIYPQRPFLEGIEFARSGTGAFDLENGHFEGKMIVVQSMQDEGHFAWQADWYRTQVKKAVGAKADDKFRVWYTDNSMHGGVNGLPAHFVSYQGVLQQALRDVSAWVEKGTVPPPSTSYKVADGQVSLPPTAKERKGVQPIVTVRANGVQRAEVKAGQPVNLTAMIDVPPGTGKVISASWDFEGAGNADTYTAAELVIASSGGATVKASHVYATPGTYFAVLHAYSQRDGDASTPFARVQNLDRVRIVVQ